MRTGKRRGHGDLRSWPGAHQAGHPHPALENSTAFSVKATCPSQAPKGETGFPSSTEPERTDNEVSASSDQTGRVTHARPSTPASTGTAGSIHQKGQQGSRYKLSDRGTQSSPGAWVGVITHMQISSVMRKVPREHYRAQRRGRGSHQERVLQKCDA